MALFLHALAPQCNNKTTKPCAGAVCSVPYKQSLLGNLLTAQKKYDPVCVGMPVQHQVQ